MRWGAALAYFGLGWVPMLLWGQGEFVKNHARLALSIHLARFIVCGVGLSGWYLLLGNAGPLKLDDLHNWLWHLTSLAVIGLPLVSFGGEARSLFLLLATLTWLIDLVACLAALQGHAVPWRSPTQSTSTNRPPPATTLEERARLRRLRDEHLRRIRYATSTAASERLRERRIDESKRELGANLVRQDHLNHLLAIGELSTERYHQLAGNVRDEIQALRDELSLLGARLMHDFDDRPVNAQRVASLGSRLHATTLSLSFVDLTGLPLFTFGHFPLDEALVAGMLSALNSLSQEVFGSPLHKTQLAEGQVLYFLHGRWCVLMGLFDAEPSPAQIGRFQERLATFEQLNSTELQRNPVSPARLRPIDFDFEFVQPA
jgi:hypothetical protein